MSPPPRHFSLDAAGVLHWQGNSALLAFCAALCYDTGKEAKKVETKDIILQLREKSGLSQDGLAQKIYVTRQAVSRWENGETVPNTETLKQLSALFGVSINTLLGAPRTLVCQCCGMPLEDGTTSREPDGAFNEDYCKWCYTDGAFTYQSMDALIDFCAAHMANDAFPPVQVRAYLQDLLPKLKHWQLAENK